MVGTRFFSSLSHLLLNPPSPFHPTLTDAPDSVMAMGSSLISNYGSTLQVSEREF